MTSLLNHWISSLDMNTIGNIETGFPVSDEIIEQDQDYFPRPWNKEQWLALESTNHAFWQWKIHERVAGWALFSIVPGDDLAHLYKILLLPEYRGSGEAQAFWMAILAELRKMKVSRVYLEVEASNLVAQKFYQKVGFELIRQAKAFYSGGEDALIMQLTL